MQRFDDCLSANCIQKITNDISHNGSSNKTNDNTFGVEIIKRIIVADDILIDQKLGTILLITTPEAVSQFYVIQIEIKLFQLVRVFLNINILSQNNYTLFACMTYIMSLCGNQVRGNIILSAENINLNRNCLKRSL